MTGHWKDLCECEQERAAILEYDAGLPRERAEEMALECTQPRCNACPKVLEKPAGWLTPDP